MALVVLATSGAQAVTCAGLFSKAKLLPEDLELAVYRFYSKENTASAQVGIYDVVDGEYFRPYEHGNLKIKNPEKGTELLASLQGFSTYVFEKVSYIDRQVRDRQPGLLLEIHPEQVTYLEATQPIARSEIDAHPELYPKEVHSFRLGGKNLDKLHIRKAGMWIISGQYMFPHNRKAFWESGLFPRVDDAEMWELPKDQKTVGLDESYNPHNIIFAFRYMPWQQAKALIDSKRMPLGPEDNHVAIDRKQFPIVFELGRVAETEPRLFQALVKAATPIMVEEVEVGLQGKISDAYVFAKVMKTDRLGWLKKVGFKVFEPACLGPTNCVLVIPLVDLLKVAEPGSNSFHAQNLAQMTKGAPLTAGLDFIRRTLTYFRAELDFIIPQLGIAQKDPIIVHDFSKNFSTLLVLMGRYTGVPGEKLQDFVNYLDKLKSNIISTTHRDEIPIQGMVPFFYEHNVVRLTNLDPVLARDPNYIPALLMALDGFIYRRYEEYRVQDDIASVMDQINFNYMIQTTRPELVGILRSYGFAEVEPIVSPKDSKKIIYSFLIKREIVKVYLEANPELAQELRNYGGMDQGFWFFRAVGANPIKF